MYKEKNLILSTAANILFSYTEETGMRKSGCFKRRKFFFTGKCQE